MDEIVPPSQFLHLHELCTSRRKTLHQFEFGTHNDTCVAPDYWKHVQAFLHDEIAHLPKNDKPKRGDTFDEHRMDGAQKELEGTIGAGSLAP